MRFPVSLLWAIVFLLPVRLAAQAPGYSSSLFNSSTFPRAINTSKPVGATAGNAGTSPSGAVTYTIPITVAPGTNGVVPSISLVYNSQGGNGTLGQGWSVSGLSVITRAGKDMYHDGKVAPVTYTDEDAFLLDGSRLSVTSGSNGADGATYGTEAESYASVISLGRVADGPEKFKITGKDGSIMEYGYTADARLQTDAGAEIMMWRLNKIQDVNGNYIEFVYDNANRDSRISQIRYTGNSVTGLAPYNTIVFEYIDRYYDKNTIYDAGNTIGQYYLLYKIKVNAEGTLYKTYTCSYGMSNIGVSFLKSVEETAATGTSLHDTRFLYGEESAALSVAASNIETPVPNTSNPYSGIKEVYLSSGDYDGDGINEIVASKLSYAPSSLSGRGTKYSWKAKVYKVSGYGSASYSDFELYNAEDIKGVAGLRMSENSLSLSSMQKRQGVFSSVGFADFNGDGREDMLSYNVLEITELGKTSYELDKMSVFYPGSAAGAFDEVNVAPSVRPALYSDNRIVPDNFVTVGDFDGDNATDFITVIQDIHGTRLGTISFPRKDELNKYLTRDPGTSGPGTYDPDPVQGDKFADADKVIVLDFDGDGKSEVLVSKWPMATINAIKKYAHGGYSLVPIYVSTFPLMTDFDDIQVGDFNGDGKSDLLLHKKSGTPNFEVAYSTGTGFNRVSLALPYVKTCSYGAGDRFFVADFNNDGKSDILLMNRYCNASYFSKTRFTAYFSCGMQFAASRTVEHNGLVSPDIQPIVMDANGDGVQELCFQSSAGPYLQFLSCETKPAAQLLQKVTDGLNRTTEFAYEPLTKGTGSGAGAFYTKGTGEAYPVNNGQYPLYVATAAKTPDGIGGISTTTYKYENLRIHRAGRGMLGFEKVSSISSTADLRTESVYGLDRDFYVPYLKSSKTFLHSSGEALSESDNTVAFTRIGSSYRYRQELRSSTARDLLMGTTTVVNDTFDVNGNVSGSGSVTTGGVGFSSHRSSTYIATGGSAVPNQPLVVRESVQRGTQPAVLTKKSYAYNSRGLLTELVDGPDGGGVPGFYYTRSLYDYDPYGNSTMSDKESYFPTPTDPKMQYGYDAFGRFMTSEENAAGGKKQYSTHPFWGKPLEETGLNGLSSTYTYDAWGKLTATEVPTGPGTSYTITYTDAWDPGAGTLYYSRVSDPSAPDMITWYDVLDRPVKTRQESFNGDWLNSVKTYDAKGNIAAVSRNYKDTESPELTTYTYDSYNRPGSETDLSGTTNYTYGDGGGYRTTSTKLPDGKVKAIREDASGKVIESSDGSGGTVVFEYDSRGNEISAGFKGATTPFIRKEYDYTGQLKKLIDLDAGTTTYNYNPLGQLTYSTDPAGMLTTYEYDELGNMVKKNVGSEYKYTYTYYGPDKDYRLASEKVESAADGTVEDTYDYAQGGGQTRHSKNTNGVQLEKHYAYDSYNRLLGTVYAPTASGSGSGFATRNEYDANGFLLRVSADLGAGTAKTLYELDEMNAEGQVTAYKRVDGLPARITYTDHRPTEWYTPGMQDLAATYNPQNGNVTGRADRFAAPVNPREFFTYDALDRLTKSEAMITGVAGTIYHTPLEITYDKLLASGTLSLGQIRTKSDVGSSYRYGGFPLNAVKSIVVDGYAVISHETQDIQYNLFHKARRITEKIGGLDYEEQFVYDAADDRAHTRQLQDPASGTVARERWYMGDYEMQRIGGLTRHIHYISGDAGLCGIVVEEGGIFSYYSVYTDHLGSIVKVADDAGATVAEQNYDAWGRERNPGSWDYYAAGTAPAKPDWLYRGYTGHEMLPEYGLINMNGRMYDPANGRMLRPDNYIQDPLNTQSYNRFAYCWNNPLKYTDPSGQIITWSFSNGGFSFGVNFTPIGIPLGAGINVSLADGTSAGVYGEVGYRVGGTGFGAGAVVSQSLDYNFDKKEVSTTTAAGAYASLGAANASIGSSYNYQASRFDWSATVGVGIGSNKAGGGMGLAVGYGSQGIIWGVGGWGRSPVNAVADKRAAAKAATRAQNATGKATFVTDGDPKAKAYVQSMAGRDQTDIVRGLEALGYMVISDGDYLRIQNAATRINKTITVVGSRASGKAGAYSDWDYVIEGGLKGKEWSKIKNSLPGARSTLDNTRRNIDILPGPVWPSYPHIKINPR